MKLELPPAPPSKAAEPIALLTVEVTEARILLSLADQIQVLLADALQSPVDTDTAVRRLLPAAYRDDPELANEWRQLSRRGLVDRKIGFARTVSTALAPIVEEGRPGNLELTVTTALDWVRSIGDLRLVIADRMGIVIDGDEGDLSEPGLNELYQLMAWLQDGLVTALDRAETAGQP